MHGISGRVLKPLVVLLALVVLALVGAPAMAVEETPPELRQVGMETGDFSRFDRTAAAAGSVTLDDNRTYGGEYAAHAHYEGLNRPGFGLTSFDVDWATGDDVWYGAAFYLPVTFPANQRADVMVVGWDNRPTYQSGADYNGVVIAASDHKAYLVRGKADGSQREVLAGPIDVPLGRWFFTEVHQRLDGAKGVNELFLDGELESKSDKPNTYGRAADQVRYGMLGLQQLAPLDLWFDRAVARKSGSDHVCNWGVTASPWMTESGSYIAAAKHEDGYPVGCWRAYSDEAPSISGSRRARVDPGSAQMVKRLTEPACPPIAARASPIPRRTSTSRPTGPATPIRWCA